MRRRPEGAKQAAARCLDDWERLGDAVR